jgi:hypothetical protein
LIEIVTEIVIETVTVKEEGGEECSLAGRPAAFALIRSLSPILKMHGFFPSSLLNGVRLFLGEYRETVPFIKEISTPR